MHRAPIPLPEQEPSEDDSDIPSPGMPSPDELPVPDHNPSIYLHTY